MTCNCYNNYQDNFSNFNFDDNGQCDFNNFSNNNQFNNSPFGNNFDNDFENNFTNGFGNNPSNIPLTGNPTCGGSTPPPNTVRDVNNSFNIPGDNYDGTDTIIYNNLYNRFHKYNIHTVNRVRTFVRDYNVYSYDTQTIDDGCSYLGSVNINSDNGFGNGFSNGNGFGNGFDNDFTNGFANNLGNDFGNNPFNGCRNRSCNRNCNRGCNCKNCC